MNLDIKALDLARWMHFVALAMGGGGMMVVLLLSGFEEGREDLQGLAATVWSKVVVWSFRIALVLGIVLLMLRIQAGTNPLKDGHYFHIKLLLVLVLVGLSEMTPKALAAAKRGTALLVLALFLVTSFVVFNKGLFGKKAVAGPEIPATAATTFQSR